MKIRPTGTILFQADARADGQTDMTKLIVAFRNMSNAPKNRGIVSLPGTVSSRRGLAFEQHPPRKPDKLHFTPSLVAYIFLLLLR